ncbi:MAG: hypothetical protein HUU15_07615 [Candidatus Brocadiae bacterium]|nr:hypothetical protein [Candidatus Brocadiia bacterium]
MLTILELRRHSDEHGNVSHDVWYSDEQGSVGVYTGVKGLNLHPAEEGP